MKFDHRVKFKGVLYEIGQDVPMEEKKAVEKANTKPQEVAKEEVADDFSQYMNAPEETKEFAYTKTEINRMSTSELKRLSTQYDIDGAENMTGGELKKVLIEKFGL